MSEPETRNLVVTQPKLVGVIMSIMMLFSCAPEKTPTPASILTEGTIKTVKAYGEYFKSEIIKIENGLIVWENRWDEQIISKQKTYQNIFTVWGVEGEGSYYYEFDHSLMDTLFPLTVGTEIVFEGLRHSRDVSAPFWAMVSVENRETTSFQDKDYDVVVINITIEYQTDEGPKRSVRALWHAVDLGINVKTKYQFEGHKFTTSVVKLELPDNMRDERSNVGTTLIEYKPNNNEQEQVVVLNKAQF